MAGQLATSAVSPRAHAPLFSASQWASLAALLVEHDLLVLPPGEDDATLMDESERDHRRASALALVQHWESLGFVLPRHDILRLCERDATTHAWMHKHATPALKRRLGGHVRHRPMYRGFPNEVVDMDEAQLLYNALLHYAGDEMGVRILPVSDDGVREPLPKSSRRKRAMRLADPDEIKDHLANLLAMNTVWTPAQAELAKSSLPLLVGWDLLGENTALAQRENQAHLVGRWLLGLGNSEVPEGPWPASRVSTTDILRACTALFGGDPSLASSSPKVRMGKLTRPQRRVIMKALDRAVRESSAPLVDLHAYRQSWLRLAEQLHAGEWKALPAAREAIHSLRNQPAPLSWAGELDAALSGSPDASSVETVCRLVRSNPGYAGRGLRRMLGWAGSHGGRVLDTFAQVAPRVDTPLLLSLEAALLSDLRDPSRQRVALPKGMVSKRYRIEKSPVKVSDNTLVRAQEICQDVLRARFAPMGSLGKVYIEPGLDEVIVPKGLRSSSSTVGTVARGSRLPVDKDAKFVRLFLWWKNMEGGHRVDVDLSAVGLDENFAHTETCNYHDLRGSGLAHSGDLTSAPRGAAEFIDVNMGKLDKRTRYVVLAANVFTGQKFSQLPECFVGWQERNHAKAQKGKIMELSTVVNKFQVTSNTSGFVAAAFDVKERKLIWLDLPMPSKAHCSIYGSMGRVQSMVSDLALYALSQPKVGHLVDLHVQARDGVRVDTPEEAQTLFTLSPTTVREDQVVIAASRPQDLASQLMVGPDRNAASPKGQGVDAIEKQDNPLDQLNAKVGAKARTPRP